MYKREGELALGTGASRGIGAAIAESIAAFVATTLHRQSRPGRAVREPALRLPKSAGKPSTGRDHAAIPTIRLSVGQVNSTRGATAHPSDQ
jgi:NAD(P)-dependent dehydrogenase (short-subunit alcohol dehydrogenase family)